jgi:hypothetical protein
MITWRVQVPPPLSVTQHLYASYRRWRNTQRARYRTRAQVDVEVNATDEALQQLLAHAHDGPVYVGMRVTTPYGDGKLLGTAR